MAEDKAAGQGKGRFTRAGVQADQQQSIDSLDERVTAIEDFLEEQNTPEPTA